MTAKKDAATNHRLFFANRTRYVILVLSILCLMMVVSNMMALNFTIICMGEGGTSLKVWILEFSLLFNARLFRFWKV